MFIALVLLCGRNFFGLIGVRVHVRCLRSTGNILGYSSESIDCLVECSVFVALEDRSAHEERGGDARVENAQILLLRNRRIAGRTECAREQHVRHEILKAVATPHVKWGGKFVKSVWTLAGCSGDPSRK